MTKTFSRARSAKAALAKILEMHESEGEITTSEVDPGRFAAFVDFDDPITEELKADLTEQGFLFTAPELELEEDEDEEEEDLPEVTADDILDGEEGDALPPITPDTPRRRSGYINEISNHMGVVAQVHMICDAMPNATRKEVISTCRAAGIAYGTARTQYQKWFSVNKR